jgi:hypothetical protein
MRASIIGFAAAAAADMLMAATLFAPSGALATTLAAPAGLKTAIHQSALVQQVPYNCRRGPHGRECYYVSAPDRNLRYDRPYSNGVNPYYQPRPYVGPGPYDYHHWGGPDAPD